MTVLDRGSDNPRIQCAECGRWMRLHGKDKDGRAIQRFYGACDDGNDHPCGKDVCADCCPVKCRIRRGCDCREDSNFCDGTHKTRHSPETVSHAQPCEAVATGGEFKCDRCHALWFGELAKTDWRPGACKQLSAYQRPEGK